MKFAERRRGGGWRISWRMLWESREVVPFDYSRMLLLIISDRKN